MRHDVRSRLCRLFKVFGSGRRTLLPEQSIARCDSHSILEDKRVACFQLFLVIVEPFERYSSE